MPTSPQRVLLIEDDRLQVRVTEQLLANARMERFEVDWAPTFEDGLQKLLTGGYAACLLDFQLGERDGLELLREARAKGNDTPVIFLTADSSEKVDAAAMEAGASDYLVKGEITPRVLERSIRYSLKLGEAMRELRRLATRDALTGLLNRRAFDALLAEEVDRARRFGHPLALIILDLDHFKIVNDTYGHPSGDAVLATAARVLESEVRTIDRVARIGGEEFAVLLMETEAKDAFFVARRLVDVMRGKPMTIGKNTTITVTISAGVAALPRYGESEAAFLAEADKALYTAKNGGRDRAVLAS
ncbi:GGDEF domain-containing response regulator [Rariglobus hedericola]|uniref:diguanylate cyclase n=1 Tax=Rariglobus hedericola TaxID=2597822 RepID=A0A556QMD6_9BACT|nr:diguanylate cyclase [Rariglobus hedericola]TSJ77806.1 diguanylate cyclase [Rariglobus hedericola]